MRLGCGFKEHSFRGQQGEGEWTKQAKMCMLKRARRRGKNLHLWTSKNARNNKYINTFSLTHYLFLRLIIKLLWHELLQTSILATGPILRSLLKAQKECHLNGACISRLKNQKHNKHVTNQLLSCAQLYGGVSDSRCGMMKLV